MGIKFSRNYVDINKELATAISNLDSIYSFIAMEEEEWNCLNERLRKKYLYTLADDLFYALGVENKINIGCGFIKYIPTENVVIIETGKALIKIINMT